MKATFQSFPSPVATRLPSLPSCHQWTLNLFLHARLLIPKINSCAHLRPYNTTLTPTTGGILSEKKRGKKMSLCSFPVRHQFDLSTPNPLSLSCLDLFSFSHHHVLLSMEPFSANCSTISRFQNERITSHPSEGFSPSVLAGHLFCAFAVDDSFEAVTHQQLLSGGQRNCNWGPLAVGQDQSCRVAL